MSTVEEAKEARRRGSVWRALAAPGSPRWRRAFNVLAWLSLAAGIVLYGNHIQREVEQKFCAVVNASLLPGGPPPQTERGRQGLRAMTDLRRDLDC